MRYGYHHLVVGIEIFRIEIDVRCRVDFGAAFVAIFLFQFGQFVFDDLVTPFDVCQNVVQIVNQLHQFGIFVFQLVDAQTGELRQTHIDNGFRLQFVQLETCLQAALSIGRRAARANDAHHFVDVVHSHNQAFENVRTLLRLAQIEFGAARYHLQTMLYKVFNKVFQVQQFRPPFDQCYVVDTERRHQGGHVHQVVDYHIGVGIAFHIDDDAHALTVGFVVDIRYAVDFAFAGESANRFDEFGFVHAIRNFGYNDAFVSGVGNFDVGFRADNDACATGFKGIFDAGAAANDAARGEIRTFDVVHQFAHFDVLIVDIGGDGIDRFLVDVFQHLEGYFRHAGFGVTHSRSTIAIDRTEVTLPIDQRVAQRPRLCHTHQRTINRRVAVRVVFTHHLAHNTGRFVIRFVGHSTQLVHAKQYTTMNRLETVAHIGQRTRNNDRHRVIDVRLLHLFVNVNLDKSFLFNHLCKIFVICLLAYKITKFYPNTKVFDRKSYQQRKRLQKAYQK